MLYDSVSAFDRANPSLDQETLRRSLGVAKLGHYVERDDDFPALGSTTDENDAQEIETRHTLRANVQGWEPKGLIAFGRINGL